MRIAIVNDSPLAVEAIRRVVTLGQRHEVLWTARDGREAVSHYAKERPDLVLMDMIMPDVDGVEATRQIMQRHPCPILIVTASVKQNCAHVFEAMGAGALDVVATPSFDDESSRLALLEKIDLLGQLAGLPKAAPSSDFPQAHAPAAVLIGSSAGGPAALAEILKHLPADLPAGVVIVQHIDERFAVGLADWLHSQSALPVRAAREGDALDRGTVLLAAREQHLIFRRDGRLGYTAFPDAVPYRPSVDRLFETALIGWTKPVVGVLLTGMGRDGAKGLKDLRDAGHFTIAQDQATSALYGMPKAAAALGAATEILPLNQIAPRIVEKITVLP